MSVDPVRLRALDILVRCQRGALLDPLLDEALDDLRRRDPAAPGAAFLAELVRGTLQWRARYDHLIARHSSRGLPADPRVLSILRLSLHQLLAMDKVPAYAAVDQAVRLCRRRVSGRVTGYVNGVLQAVRRAWDAVRRDGDAEAADRPDLRALLTDPDADPAARLAVWHSHPRWLVDRWLAAYGPERTEAILDAGNARAPLCFQVLDPGQTEAAAAVLATGGCPVKVGEGPGSLLAAGRCGRALLADLLAGLPGVIVQDVSVAAATAWLCQPAATTPPALPVLDMCAAPGGKSVVLAGRWPGDAPVVAMDVRAERLRLLAATVARTGSSRVLLVGGDGQAPPLPPRSCAAVLLDGPCSGTGVLRHHPDGRWRLEPQIVAANGRRLLALARQAVELLAPGGLLMYATCSLEREENEDVLAALLAERDDLAPVTGDAAAAWQRRWWPTAGAGDGFFAARLRRTH